MYLVDNGTERQFYVLEGGDQCAIHGFSSVHDVCYVKGR